jgi:hypothetical protein
MRTLSLPCQDIFLKGAHAHSKSLVVTSKRLGGLNSSKHEGYPTNFSMMKRLVQAFEGCGRWLHTRHTTVLKYKQYDEKCVEQSHNAVDQQHLTINRAVTFCSGSIRLSKLQKLRGIDTLSLFAVTSVNKMPSSGVVGQDVRRCPWE